LGESLPTELNAITKQDMTVEMIFKGIIDENYRDAIIESLNDSAKNLTIWNEVF